MRQLLFLFAIQLSVMTLSRGNNFKHVPTAILIGYDYQRVEISKYSQENDVVRKCLDLGAEFQVTEKVNFTLRNNRPVSIPLIIPGVMNPNLSPFSKSGVELSIGQEILFLEKGKRYVLLVVDERISDGKVIDVGKLMKRRRKEVGLR